MMRTITCVGILGAIILFLSSCFAFGMEPFGPGMEDYSYSVGTGYMLDRTSGHQISIVPQDGNDGTKPEIGAKVVQVAWDERYVLAKRFGLKKAYPDNPNNSYEIPDETNVQYYILDTIDLKLYGGFDLDEFEQTKVELEISDELILKDVGK